MAVSAETAGRLRGFVEAVQRRAGGDFPTGSSLGSGTLRRRSIYERCVDELSNDESDTLDRLLEKMCQAMPSPPGAIQPQ